MPGELIAGEAMSCTAKIRYRQDDQPCTVSVVNRVDLAVDFASPQVAVTPGQYAVFYADERCLGGAAIEFGVAAKGALRKTG